MSFYLDVCSLCVDRLQLWLFAILKKKAIKSVKTICTMHLGGMSEEN